MLLTIRYAHVLCLISVTACAPAPSGGASPPPRPLTETMVTVSARQLRIAFPVDTAERWGWPEHGYTKWRRQYTWRVSVNGMDGPRTIAFDIYRDSAAKSFSSLRRLVAAGSASLWRPGMFGAPESVTVTSKVERNRLVLTVNDSAAIARLFGMRPALVRAYREDPAKRTDYQGDSVAVHYVDPQIPFPDSATRADSARSRRRYEASVTSITRSIAGLEPSLWLARGDSAYLWVGETECHYDVCYSFGRSVDDSGWSVGDTSIVGLHSSCRDTTAVGWPRSDRCLIRGIGLGHTTVSVHGLHGPSDTAASRSPPATELERTIVVGPPLSRIVLTPRPDTVALDEPVVFQVKVFDREGQAVNGVPVELTAEMDRYFTTMEASGPVTLNFHLAGERKVFASFREFADTIRVMVVDRKP